MNKHFHKTLSRDRLGEKNGSHKIFSNKKSDRSHVPSHDVMWPHQAGILRFLAFI